MAGIGFGVIGRDHLPLAILCFCSCWIVLLTARDCCVTDYHNNCSARINVLTCQEEVMSGCLRLGTNPWTLLAELCNRIMTV